MNKAWIIVLRDLVFNLVQSLLSILRVLVHSKFKTRSPLKSNASSCVILGNGPSLSASLEAHAAFLTDKLLICVNHFPKTDDYEKLKPSVFITSAPDLWLDNIEPHFVESSTELFEAMAKKTTWPLQLFIPFEARPHKRWKSPLKENDNITIIFYNNTPIEGGKWFTRTLFNSNLGMPRPHNVMIPSLFLAINAGIKKIYLLGADHSWLPEIEVNDQNQVLINQKHFYDEQTSTSKPLDKRGKGERRLWELLHKFMLAFKGYFILNDYATTKNVEILNATPVSYIDAFERIDLTKEKR